MSVRGDVESSLVGKFGFAWEQATDILRDVLDTIDDPNFAYRYAKFQGDDNASDEENNKLMCEYWDVVTFLKSLV